MNHLHGSRRRLLLLAGMLLAAAAAVLAAFLLGRSHGRRRRRLARPSPVRSPARAGRTPAPPTRLAEHALTSLAAPVQDAAAVALAGGRVMLLGGLTAAETSRADVRIVDARGDRRVGSLPVGLHDRAAVRIGNDVYVFGGANSANTQSDQVVRVSASGGRTAVAGRLPAPSSDQAAAALGGTAYIVGGYTGSRWLDTIVAGESGLWRARSAAQEHKAGSARDVQ